MTQDEHYIYTAFGSPLAASEFTGGDVYDVRGHEGNAFILTDTKGSNFVYVRPQYLRYRELANQVAGERIAATNDDADHAASRTIADQRGGRFVLLARVPTPANRSAGKVEKLNTLDGHFNYAAAKRTDDGDIGLRMTHRQGQKVVGRKVDEYQKQPVSTEQLRNDAAMQRALFQSPDNQRNIENMKGERIAFRNQEQQQNPVGTEAVATGIRGPWDRRRENNVPPPPYPRTPGRQK